VGRTARAGRKGSALTYLHPSEDTYIHFLAIRKVPISELPLLPMDGDSSGGAEGTDGAGGSSSSSSGNDGKEGVLAQCMREIIADRDLLEKGTRAFVSFCRSYKEHQCQFIFRFHQLDLASVARAFVLLQLPRMKEISVKKMEASFVKSDVDIAQIRYKDKHREKKRQKDFQEGKLKLKKEKREKNLKEKAKKAEESVLAEVPRRRKKSKNKEILQEWDELAEEERNYKKLKAGKMTEEEYDRRLMCTIEPSVLRAAEEQAEKAAAKNAALGRRTASSSDEEEDSDDEGGEGKMKLTLSEIRAKVKKQKEEREEEEEEEEGEDTTPAANAEEVLEKELSSEKAQIDKDMWAESDDEDEKEPAKQPKKWKNTGPTAKLPKPSAKKEEAKARSGSTPGKKTKIKVVSMKKRKRPAA
jgi:ATP-dependent RNA helicase DDX55/SPB4